MNEFAVDFHAQLNKIYATELKHDLKCDMMLCQTGIDGNNRNIVIRSAGGDYSLQAL